MLGDYLDSASRAAAVQQRAKYAAGIAAINSGKYFDAYTIFTELGDYEDSTAKAYILAISNFATLKTVAPGVATFSFHNNYGLVNLNDNITVAPQWTDVGSFTGGLAVVKKAGKYGVVNLKGKVIADYIYYSISDYYNGFAIACTSSGSGRSVTYSYILLNTEGKKIGSSWAYIGDSYGGHNWGRARFYDDMIMIGTYDSKTRSYLYGYMNKSGRNIVTAKYVAAKNYSNGLAAVKDAAGWWGFIDLNGNTVIPHQYTDVTSFNENGLADVCLYGEWSIIDKPEKLCILSKYLHHSTG